MDRISDPTAALNLFGAGKHGFTDGDPLGGIDPTFLNAVWFNGAQEAPIRVIEGAGIVPAAADHLQLLQAIRRLCGGNIRSISANTVLGVDDAGLILVSAAAGNVGIFLPPVAASGGHPIPITIVRTDVSTNSVTLAGAGADTIEGVATWPVRVGARLTLIGDGVSGWRAIADDADRLIGVRLFKTAGTFTYVETPGTSKVVPEVVGGGGGAGGAPAAGAGLVGVGGGGSSGAYGVTLLTSGFSGVTITVGPGGTGGTGTFGGSGGASSFGGFVSAPGGPGGTVAGPTASPWSTGTLGTANASGGNLWNSPGTQGGVSVAVSTAQGNGGAGGGSRFGAGGAGTGAGGGGADALAPGSGGGGTMSPAGSGALKGGDGAPGAVLVWEYS